MGDLGPSQAAGGHLNLQAGDEELFPEQDVPEDRAKAPSSNPLGHPAALAVVPFKKGRERAIALPDRQLRLAQIELVVLGLPKRWVNAHPTGRENGDPLQVEKRVEVSAKQQSVINAIRLFASVGRNVRSFEHRLDRGVADGTGPPIRPE
jgi:hypothetical protein